MLGVRLPGALIEPVVGVLIHYLREEQAILASTTAIQASINALLDRPSPTRPLVVRDLHVNFSIASSAETYPYLFDAIDEALGIRVESTASAIDIIDARAESGGGALQAPLVGRVPAPA